MLSLGLGVSGTSLNMLDFCFHLSGDVDENLKQHLLTVKSE